MSVKSNILKKFLFLIFILCANIFLNSCAEFLHDIRNSNNKEPTKGLIEEETESKKILSQNEKIQMLTGKLVMLFSMKGLEGLPLCPGDSSKMSYTIVQSLVKENVATLGTDNELFSYPDSLPVFIEIKNVSSGITLLKVELPEE